jgi:hypothetical protein
MSVSPRVLRTVAAAALSMTLAGAAFASPSASIEQVRNGLATATTTPTPTWVSGNAGGSNSHYLESHSIPYRTVMGGLPTDGTVVELIMGYAVKKSGSYAIDYLTQFQRVLPHVMFGHTQPEVFDPLNGVTGVASTVTTAPIPLPTLNLVVDPDGAASDPPAAQPSTSMSALPDAERVMTLYGGTLIDVSYVTEGDVGLATSTSETQVRVRFRATSPTAVLAWGGHIACRWDWGFNADGSPRSAGGISGSSYHMRLVNWTLGSLGNQDRSLSTDAVYPVPQCEISNLGPFCPGSTNTHTSPGGMASYHWELINNTSGAAIVGSDTSLSVVVSAGLGGSYGLLLTTGASGFTKQCQGTVTVLAPLVANAGLDQAVCASSPQVQLAGQASGGNSIWSGGAGTFSPGASALNALYTPAASEITAGTVTLTLTTSSPTNTCPPVSDRMTITIQRAPTANAGPDQILCAASPLVHLVGTVGGSASGGVWSGGAGAFSPGASALNATYAPTPEEITAGSVTLTLTTLTAGGPCPQASDQVSIAINPVATADAGADQTVCASSPQVQLAGAVGGGAASGTWSGGTGTFSPGASTLNSVYTPSAAEITAGSVTLKLTTNDPTGPCGAVSAQMHVTISRAVVTNAGPDQTVCSNSPQVQLAGSVSGGATTGAWSGGAGTFNPSASALNATYTPSASELAAGSVTLTLTSDTPATSCPQTNDQITITIAPAATASAGQNQTVCASSPQVQLAGSVGGGASSGTWSGGAGTYSPNASALNATYTPSASEIAAGSATLTLTTNDPSGPCAAATAQVRIDIRPAAITNAGADVTVCSSSPQVQLAGSVSGGAASGVWSGGAGTYNPSASALNATYTPSASEIAAGSVTLTLTSDVPSASCPQTTDRMTITIAPAATANAGPNQTVCASSPQVQLAGSVGGGASSGTWSGGAGTYSPNASALNATYTPSAAEIAAGSATLTLTTNDPAGPCAAMTDQVRIDIRPAAITNAGADVTVCSSSPQVQLAGSVSGGAASGVWSGGAGTYTPGASALNATYTPSAAEIAAGSVTLTLTSAASAGPCPQTNDRMTITIAPAATANAGPNQTVCASSPQVQLAGSVGGGASSGTWSGGAGTYSPNASALNATYTPSAAEIAAGSATLTLTTNDPAGPCASVNNQMHINIVPVTVVDAGPDQTVCASTPRVQLQGSVSGGVTSGAWSGGSGTFSPSASALNATYTPSAAEIAAGSVTLTLTSAVSTGPCPRVSDQMTIFIGTAATANAGPDQIVCAASVPVIRLAGSIGGSGTTGTWSGGTGVFDPDASSLNGTYTPTAAEIAAGSVTLTLTSNDPTGPCPAVSDQVKLTFDAPTVTVADRVVCSGITPVSLCASVGQGIAPYTYRWSNGATSQCITVADTGSYTVTITDAKGCQATGRGAFRWRECIGQLAHTSTTCADFLAGNGLDFNSVSYVVKDNIITSIAPGVFFYYTKFIAPSSDFTVYVVQTKDNLSFPYCAVQQSQVSLDDSNCNSFASGSELTTGQSAVVVHGARPGQVFIGCVKYSLKGLVGTYMDPTMGCHYDFRTEIDGRVVDADPDGFQIGVARPIVNGGSGGDGTGSGDSGDNTRQRGSGDSGGTTSPSGPGPTGGIEVPAGPGTISNAGGLSQGSEGAAFDSGMLERAVPNPFRNGMHMVYDVGTMNQRVSIGVYDLAGRLVRTLASGVQSPGHHGIEWDGRDEQGSRVNKGMYFIHVRIGDRAREVRVTFLQ